MSELISFNYAAWKTSINAEKQTFAGQFLACEELDRQHCTSLL